MLYTLCYKQLCSLRWLFELCSSVIVSTLPEHRLILLLTSFCVDLSETWQVKYFPVFHSVWGMLKWLLTATRPSPSIQISSLDAGWCWDPDSHLTWGLKPHALQNSFWGPESSVGATRSSIDGSPRQIHTTESSQLDLKRAMTRNVTSWVKLVQVKGSPTEHIPNGVGEPGLGKALSHFTGECLVFVPMIFGDRESSNDRMEVWGFWEIHVHFPRDVVPVGLKGYVEVTGGEICDGTLQQSSRVFYQVWEVSSNQHRWSTHCRPWATQEIRLVTIFRQTTFL